MADMILTSKAPMNRKQYIDAPSKYGFGNQWDDILYTVIGKLNPKFA